MHQPRPESADDRAGKENPKRRVTRVEIVFALQLALVVVLAYLIGERFTALFHGASASIGALWCAITGITVLHATRQETWLEGIQQMLGALIGAIISGIYLSFLPFSPVGMAISVAITVLVCQVIGFAHSSKLAATSVVMIMVISYTNPDLNPVLNAALRFCEACIGAAIAMGLVLVFPKPLSTSQEDK